MQEQPQNMQTPIQPQNMDQPNMQPQMIKKGPKKGLSRFMTLLLTIFLIITSVALIIKTTVLNPSFTAKTLMQDDSIEQMYEQTNATIVNSVSGYGITLPQDTEFITKEQFEDDLTDAIENLYAGNSEIIDQEKLSHQIQHNLTGKIDQLGLPSGMLDQVLSPLTSTIANIFTQQLASGQLNSLMDSITAIDGYVSMAMIVGVIAVIVTGVIILFAQRNIFAWLHYLGIGFLISGLVVLGLQMATDLTSIFVNTNQNQIANQLIQSFVTAVKSQMMTLAIGEVILGAIALVLGLLRKLKFSFKRGKK